MTENNPCSIDFPEFNTFFVKLLFISFLDYLYKKIKQEFIQDKKNYFWWENGLVISKYSKQPLNVIVNNIECDDYDDNETLRI